MEARSLEEIKSVTKKSLSLVIQPTQIILSENLEYSRPSLTISRNATPEVSLAKNISLTGTVYEKLIYGVVGIIPLLSGPYLMVITDCEDIGTVDGNHIFQVKDVDTIAILDQAFGRLTTQQQKEELKYLEMYNHILKYHPHFYFSYSYNLTKSLPHYLKKKSSTPQDEKKNPKKGSKQGSEGIPNEPDLWTDVEERYIWNFHMQTKFIESAKEFGNWFVPLINGFIQIKKDCNINNKKVGFTLISRRSKRHAGTRYHSRGADEDGNVANYVETEQSLEFPDGSISTFVQIRGSVPVVWKQEPTLDYEPPIVLYEESSSKAFEKHFREQLNLYENIIAVDLLKAKGSESKIGGAYRRHVNKLNTPSLKYVDFDMHHHCKATNLSKLSILVDKIKDDLNAMSYNYFNGSKQIKKQSGVFRTNCKDCLDRTNVVQGLLARLSLVDQLKDFGIVRDEQDLQNNTSFMQFFRNAWADNGDVISTFYAGTPAMRSEFTRTGKYTVMGMIADGVNSVTRYYLNNISDGTRQDAIDLFVGNYVPSKRVTHYFSDKETYAIYIVGVFATIFYALAPSATARMKHDVFLAVFWMAIFFIAGKLFRMKSKIVGKPKFNKAPKQQKRE